MCVKVICNRSRLCLIYMSECQGHSRCCFSPPQVAAEHWCTCAASSDRWSCGSWRRRMGDQWSASCTTLWTAPSSSQTPGEDNNNDILYSSQREIKAVVRSHNEERISVILSRETRMYTLLDICPLSLNLNTLTANPKLAGIMLSLSNRNVKTLKLNKNH